MLYTGTPGNDTFAGGSDNDTANGNGGNDTLLGGVGNDVITGDDGNDSLNGEWGNDSLYGGAGLDTLDGGFGDDVLIDSDGGSLMNGGDGFDTLAGGTGTDQLNGGANSDSLEGGGGSDVLTDGESGDVTADTLLGGTGDDVLISRGGADTIDGGDGIDSLILDRTAYAGALVIDLAQMATPGGTVLGDGTRISSVELAEIRSGSGNDTLLGAGAADRLQGGAGQDSISGGSGHDRLDGEDGDDLLLGGGGNDTLSGGNGTDTVSYANAGGAVTVNLALATAQNTGSGGTDMLSGIENANGSFFTDILVGNTAANSLDGGAGADTLVGGAGNDSYVADHAGDTVQESAGNGVDIVYASLSWTLAGNVENLILSGGDINGTGNGLNNALTGTAGNNVLDGKGGSDIMTGGLGDDTYYVDHIQDNVAEQHLQGTDTILSSVSYSLFGRAVETLTLTGAAVSATGNGLNNTLTGTDSNNVLDGGGGADKLVGGLGDDTYYVDHIQDNVAEQHLQGNDTVFSTVTYSLFGRAVEALILTGAAHIAATGNSLANTLTGNSGNNAIDGGDGNDTLTGGDGQDSLNGNVGADSLAGGTGDDSYVVDNVGDVVLEQADQGRDRVTTGLSHTLSANLEDLILTGSALTATGNGLDNALTGTDSANVLNGLGGNDTLSGGKGNDTYYVDSAGDTIVEAIGGGTDLALASASYVLADTARVETLTLTGSGNLDATGNIAANTVNGNSGNNRLDGGGGLDTMIGGLGDDTYYVNSLDVVIEATGGGYDSVVLQSYDRTDFALAADSEIEAVTIMGNGQISVVGNGFNNRLDGNNAHNRFDGRAGNDELLGQGGNDSLYGDEGNDTLNGGAGGDRVNGGAGDDSMTGGLGDDTYYIDSDSDVVIELADQGLDTILVNASYSLAGTHIEGLQLNVATGNFNLTGNEAANRIAGNDGDNLLDGGAGADSLLGGTGNDTYVVDDAGDLLYEDADEGIDTIVTSVSFEMSFFYQDFENITLTGSAYSAKGNSRANVLTGNSGNNYLDGSAGNDTLIGGDGNDIYVLSGLDQIIESENGGTDQVSADTSYSLEGAAVENLTLQNTSAALNATGNALNNYLTGNSYANLLDGGAGADTMVGAKGNDTYVVDNNGDVAVETSSQDGRDLIQTAGSYTLGNFIEDLTLTGSGNIDGTGNALSNVLTGNAGINVLNGGAGHDTYYIQNVGDTVVDTASGNDVVFSLVSFVLSDGVERLSLQGTDNLTGTGNSGDNQVSGNAGNNLLEGGGGFDILFGGNGNDTLTIDGNDEANGGGGIDTLFSSVSVDLDVGEDQNGHVFGFETVILTGSDDASIYAGGVGNESFYGNTGSNYLYGGDGDDRLDGGVGNDDLDGGDGADLFLFNLDSDQDKVDNFTGSDGDRIDVSAYTGGVANVGMVSQVGSHTVIDLGDGNTISVQYTTINDVLPYIVW
ncbi:beta strand repeat-containing protein [Asticcacaulis biprosthecium]|uniref:beta strand repeat-containing protein n=1 Tax=Asticcacaulis biprosthecium TaxID=76891 RepID=UPI000313EDF9|nr:calcium-binding protein [Asticcacaulis biprosthecium]